MTSPTRSIYLDAYVSLLAPFLSRPDVSDIYINKPGEIWLEAKGRVIERHDVPDLTGQTLQRFVRQVAAFSAQGISREHPILAGTMPGGERIQIVVPPATRGEIAISIRKQIISSLDLTELKSWRGTEEASTAGLSGSPLDADGDIANVLDRAVRLRKTILISGGTSSGKTTLLNSLLRKIPEEERLIVIEDTPELEISHQNAVGLIASRSALREADVDTDDLLIASLRMRPDRIILGEIRGREAVTFLRAINTGHPGSMTTIHANSYDGAIDQLAFLAIQGGLKLSWQDLRAYIASSIDVSVNVKQVAGSIYCTWSEGDVTKEESRRPD